MNKIRAMIMDVDGTLTDGGIYVGSQGEVLKKFNVKDGYGIKTLLPAMGIKPIIITGRTSDIVRQRCDELNITRLVQGSNDKLGDMITILQEENISLSETAYIGDDLNDLECMKVAALRGCPHDAIDEVKSIADFVSGKYGGMGAVRDFINWINKNRYYLSE